MSGARLPSPPTEPFDPLDPAYLDDPYALLAHLQERCPVFFAPAIGMWVITRHGDIERALTDPATFSSANVQAPLQPLSAETRRILSDGGIKPRPTISSMDEPQHSRLRTPLSKAFSARRIAAMQDTIRAYAEECVAAMLDGHSHADIVAAVARPLTTRMIYALIGFPAEDADELYSWGEERLLLTWGRPLPVDQARIARNTVAYRQYCGDFVSCRGTVRSDDITSDLLDFHDKHPDRLDVEEIASLVYTLSLAGHEAPTHLISNTVRGLLETPRLWQQVRADRSLIPGVVEEILRYDAPNFAWRRVTTVACTLSGVPIPAGAQLLLVLGAAGRDPDVFPRPQLIDPHRANSRSHLSFGKGIHFCVGAALARTQAATVVETLAERAPGLRLIPGQELRYPASIGFRGPIELHVSW